MTKPKLIETCRNCGTEFRFSKNVFYCSLECRFWSNVDKTGECWEWTASIANTGYGQLNVRGSPKGAHRLSWEIHNGDIPTGRLVCHKCDNRRCVNPSHLFLGTHKDNLDDMAKKGRSNRKYSKKMIRSVKQKLADGVPKRQIARDEGTSDAWVRYVEIGAIHKHV